MGAASELVDQLQDHDATVATAESLTGGRLAARLTEAPGSSAVYLGGVVTYATEAKRGVLDVPEEVVERYGVISEECARAMAEGARRLFGSTYALSTTGVAGPDTQEDKPVGTVFVGLAGPDGTSVLSLDLDGDRQSVQEDTVAAAVAALADQVATAKDLVGPDAEEPVLG
ncbi:MAG TPA: CinA family protein [Nocardioides sp.]|nr:CinA family protein [Nocardioides sp.]